MKTSLRNLAAGALLVCAFVGVASAKTTLEFHKVIECMPGDHSVTFNGDAICVQKGVVADLTDVTSAAIGTVSGSDAIRLTLNPAGAARMKAATAHPGGKMAIIYNGTIVSTPVFVSPVSDFVEIDFGTDGPKLKEIAAALKSALHRK
jgi:preprotein translocase subunit SecD